MKRILVILTFAILLLSVGPAQAQPLALTSAGVPLKQYLRIGFNIPSLPISTNLGGRMASASAELKSARDKGVLFVFPATAGRRIVYNAALNILSRSGAYAGEATLTLAVFDAEGHLQHSATSESVDLQTAALQTWLSMKLPSEVEDRLIEPGEFLAFYLALDGAPSGDLDVRPTFEVTVGAQELYLPIVRR